MNKDFIQEYGKKIDRMIMSLNLNYLDFLQDLMEANGIVVGKLKKCYMRILWALDAHGVCPIGKLAELVGITNKNIHHYISRLCEQGYAARKAAPNNCTLVLVELTGEGQRILKEGNEFADAVMLKRFNEKLSDAEQRELEGLTERITQLYNKLA